MTISRRAAFGFLLCLLFIIPLRSQTVRQYTVKRVSSPLQIDGKLLEADWTAAPLTELFLKYGGPAQLGIQAKMLWDDTNLYIRLAAGSFVASKKMVFMK